MAQPILLHVAPRDPQHELNVQLQEAPAKHAEAILAAYEVLQEMHDRGVLDLMRGTLGGGEKYSSRPSQWQVDQTPFARRATCSCSLRPSGKSSQRCSAI